MELKHNTLHYQQRLKYVLKMFYLWQNDPKPKWLLDASVKCCMCYCVLHTGGRVETMLYPCENTASRDWAINQRHPVTPPHWPPYRATNIQHLLCIWNNCPCSTHTRCSILAGLYCKSNTSHWLSGMKNKAPCWRADRGWFPWPPQRDAASSALWSLLCFHTKQN